MFKTRVTDDLGLFGLALPAQVVGVFFLGVPLEKHVFGVEVLAGDDFSGNDFSGVFIALVSSLEGAHVLGLQLSSQK